MSMVTTMIILIQRVKLTTLEAQNMERKCDILILLVLVLSTTATTTNINYVDLIKCLH